MGAAAVRRGGVQGLLSRGVRRREVEMGVHGGALMRLGRPSRGFGSGSRRVSRRCYGGARLDAMGGGERGA
jgi:hypothetical protein